MREGCCSLQKISSHKTVGHLFKIRISIFENFPSLFCLGLEAKGAEFPQRNNYRGFVVLTSLESFSFQTASQIFLCSSKYCCLPTAENYSIQKERALCWCYRVLCTIQMSSSAFLLFGVVVSCALYDLHIHSVSEFLLDKLLTCSVNARDLEIFCGLLSVFLQSSSKEICRSFAKILESVKMWDAFLTQCFL